MWCVGLIGEKDSGGSKGWIGGAERRWRAGV